jgi:hypothetical protein
MKMIEDDRRVRRVDPNHCKVGDLYRPWFLIDDPSTGSKGGTNHACLIYKRSLETLDTRDVHATSFITDVRGDERAEYNRDSLRQSIEADGQLARIICTRHYTADADSPIDPLLNDPKLEGIHCFEGHHRLVCCEELGRPVEAEVYDLYHMDLPVDYRRHYHSNYGPTFWSHHQTEQSKGVWFHESTFDNIRTAHKAAHLDRCFAFIQTLNVDLKRGIDIGCAEGAHTFWAADILADHMTGMDLEPGRVIRGLLMRAKHERTDVDFFSSPWDDVDYSSYDFAMGLSILHHVDDPQRFLHKVSVNKKVMIFEVRLAVDEYRPVNRGTIIGMNTRSYYENLFRELGMKSKLVSGPLDADRYFYVLWR